MPLTEERVLITGAGQIGRALHAALSSAGATAVELMPHSQLEITDAPKVAEAFAAFRPTLVFHTAALTRVDYCEREPLLAQRVNGEGTENVVKAAAKQRARVVSFSTDYVFPGSDEGEYGEYDAPAPVNAYGRAKLVGEQATLTYPKGLVIRTAQVFGPGGRNFLAALAAQVAEGKPFIKVLADEIATPTYAPHLATGTLALVERAGRGIYHLRGPKELSYFHWAERFFTVARLPADRLQAISRDKVQRDAPRPRRSVLGMQRYFDLKLPPLPPLDEALRDYVAKQGA